MHTHSFNIDDEISFPISEGKFSQIPVVLKGEAEYDECTGTWTVDYLEIRTSEYKDKKWNKEWVRIDDLPEHKNFAAAAEHYLNETADAADIFNLPAFNPVSAYAAWRYGKPVEVK
jgi:hypothetical protein